MSEQADFCHAIGGSQFYRSLKVGKGQISLLLCIKNIGYNMSIRVCLLQGADATKIDTPVGSIVPTRAKNLFELQVILKLELLKML